MLAGLAAVIIIIAVAVYFRSERRDTAAYFEAAREIVATEVGIAAELETTLRSLEGSERQDLLARVAELQEDAAATRDGLEALDDPSRAGKPHGYLTVALETWADGLGALDDAILVILDDPADPAGEAALAAAFELLSVGDRAYLGFQEALTDLDEDDRPRPFPDMAFIAEEQRTLYDVELTTDRLQRLQQLTIRHDVGVTLSIDPVPAGDVAGIMMVPFSDSLDAFVAVSNLGNEPEIQIVVTLELVTVGEVDVYTAIEVIGNLAAGDTTSVSFADLPAAPGGLHDLSVTAEIDEDADDSNNRARLLFQRNQPA
jgi:hypothetical protein